MNYIELINNFWKLNKEHSFTPNEKAVYFALLNKCNELMWKNPFNQSNAYLSLDSGMSESAMIRSRNLLAQKGLINFSSGKQKRQLTTYHLGTLKNNLSSSRSDSLIDSRSSSRSDSLIDENGLDNNKHKTKQKETKLNCVSKEKISHDFLSSKNQGSNLEYFESLINGDQKNILAKQIQIPLDEFMVWIEKFKDHCELEYLTFSKFCFHLKNWVQKEKSSAKKENKNIIESAVSSHSRAMDLIDKKYGNATNSQ